MVHCGSGNCLLWTWKKCTHEADRVLVRAEGIPCGAHGRAPLQQVFCASLSHAAEGTGVGRMCLVSEKKGVGIVGNGRGSSLNVFMVVEDACVV